MIITQDTEALAAAQED